MFLTEGQLLVCMMARMHTYTVFESLLERERERARVIHSLSRVVRWQGKALNDRFGPQLGWCATTVHGTVDVDGCGGLRDCPNGTAAAPISDSEPRARLQLLALIWHCSGSQALARLPLIKLTRCEM